MRGRILFGLAAVALLGCVDADAPAEPEYSVPVFRHDAEPHENASGFRTHLSGDEEVPARPTRAQGQAIFTLNDDGTLGYRLIVANIENVTQAQSTWRRSA